MARVAKPMPPVPARSRAYEATREEDAGLSSRAPAPADAFRGAVRAFIREPRLDMGRLAQELGISKATLYRWTGSREQLLGDVLAYLSEGAFEIARRETEGLRGTERVIGCIERYLEAIVSFPPLRRFLQNETPMAMRVLTRRGGAPQASAVHRITELLAEERSRGLTLRADADVLAYAITRIGEGFIYNEAVADTEPEVDTAIDVIRLLIE